MRIRSLFVFCLVLCATESFSPLETKDEEVFLHVLLQENSPGALIDVTGGYKVFNPEDGKQLSSGIRGKRYYVQANKSGLKWGEGYPGIYQIKIVPKDPSTTILIDGIQYKGSVVVYNVNSSLQIVNEVDVEEVLKTSLSAAFSTRIYEQATYEAIAIAARTHLYYTILHATNPYWHAKASEIQYSSHASILSHADIERAVQATSHMVLAYKEKPFATSWTEHSAGRTASYATVFRKKVSCPDGVSLGYAQKMREESRWKSVLSLTELQTLTGLKKISHIDLFQDPTSKKVYGIRFSDGKLSVEWTIVELRQKVGLNRILSSDFSVKLVHDQVEFIGYGKGYGVGICLFTADQMAKIGDAVPEILSHFFPDAILVKLNSLKGIYGAPESLPKKG